MSRGFSPDDDLSPGDDESSGDDRPAAVRVFDAALADWLASFTMPGNLAGEMADACADGAAWAAAIGGVAARRAGWSDGEAMAWGLCVGGLAGALEAGGRALAGAGPHGRDRALPLLASDALVAGAHEALASLEPARALEALEALAAAFGDGGPWRAVGEGSGTAPAAWAALVPCAMELAAREEPDGPWSAWAAAWRDPRAAGPRELWDHPRGDRGTRALLRVAARVAWR